MRYYYRLILTGIRVMRNEGWHSFWSKFKSWQKQRAVEWKRARSRPPVSDTADD